MCVEYEGTIGPERVVTPVKCSQRAIEHEIDGVEALRDGQRGKAAADPQPAQPAVVGRGVTPDYPLPCL